MYSDSEWSSVNYEMPRFVLRLLDWNAPPPLGRAARVLVVVGGAVLLVIALAVFWTYYSAYSPAARAPQERSESDLSTHNYGVVIDAGSSGSKVQLFHWAPHNGDPAKLLQIEPLTDEFGAPLIMKTEPGISTFTATPEKAFESLRPLLDFALLHLPPAKHHQTSLLVLGTAGMRLLDEEEREMLVGTLQQRIPEEYPFHLPQDGVEVISGKMEGVFSWITINYLLGRFTPEHHQDSVTSSGGSTVHTVSTVGSMDMGGASLQVAFEIPQNMEAPSADMVDINLGCGIQDAQHKHRVFITTYLSYGTNEARRRYYKMLAQQHSNSHNRSQLPLAILRDPCLPLHMQESVEVGSVTLKLRGLGDFHACRRALTPLLKENSSECNQERSGCQQQSFKRPPVSYDSVEFYGTSEFWYSMRDVLGVGGAYRAASFEKAAKEYCSTLWSVLEDRYHRNLYPYADFYRLKTQCLKSAWMSLILHEEGLGLPERSTLFTSAATIRGHSVQWALGALLYHIRFLPLREIQLHQLMGTPSPWVSSDSLMGMLVGSSFLLPFAVVVFVALLLLACRHRRPHHYGNLSRSTSYPSLTSRQGLSVSGSRRGSLAPMSGQGSMSRVASLLQLGRNQSSNILSSIGISTASSAATSGY